MEYQQIECEDSDGALLIVWVECGRVKTGTVVSFKETGDRTWFVTRCYSTIAEHLNRGWGLDLPKSQRTER